MAVSDRIRIIMQEKGLNQTRFAESIYATKGYISRLLKGEIGMSNSTAMLIEKVHGYTREWIRNGIEPKLSSPDIKTLTPVQRKIIQEVESMTDDELFFIATYIEALKKKKAGEKMKK
ncbi:MAG: helix-turn-helix domain-containing protein [Treponema sp.]|nr:helix-turn-helix domain-containing protein [Treponema sp.]